MDFEGAFSFAEGYARGYIAYLFAFFGEAPRASVPEEAVDPLKSVLIYGLLSAALGGALSHYGRYGHFPTSEWLMTRVAMEFAYWIGLGLVLYFVMRLLQARTAPMDILVVVLGVAPVAFALGGYVGFLTYNIAKALPKGWADWGPWAAYVLNVVTQAVMSAAYLPIYVGRLPGVDRGRTLGGSLLTLLVILAVQYAYAAPALATLRQYLAGL